MRQLYPLKHLIAFVFPLTITSHECFSQTFSNRTVVPISNMGSTSVPITVAGLSSIDTLTFGLQSVQININEPNDPELTLQLQSPDGTTILLANNLTGTNYSNTIFDGTSAHYIDFGSAPFTNNYRPIQDLSYLNNFQNPNGSWNLIIIDSGSNTGTVQGVTLNFSDHPAKPILSSSNLPIIIINTNGQEINNDTKITADMKVIYNGPGHLNSVNQTSYNYLGKIGIKLRGHGSLAFPKKQFSIETRDSTGDNLDVSLLGLPADNDWVLNASYSDKTLMRNVLACKIANDMGRYASRTVYCEVIINNEYRGIYIVEEKIKKGVNRVNITKLKKSDITPPNVTGGYIYSKDYLDGGEVTFQSKIPGSPTVYQFVYPKAEDVQPAQLDYLSNYVDSFEEALYGKNYQDPVNGFRKYANDTTFMDYFIVNEVSKNIDGFRLSSYFNKDRGGKINAGPVWDFDIAWGNAKYDSGSYTSGYSYAYHYDPSSESQVPFIWPKLMTDILWKENMICRYNSFRNTFLANGHLFRFIDSLAAEIQVAQQRNFNRWNIIGKQIWPNPSPVPTSFADEVTALKNWISDRLYFLDNHLDYCGALSIHMIDFMAENNELVNTITWTTTNDQIFQSFIIERSADGETFTEIGTVNADKKAAVSHSYSFNDPNARNGLNVYRLKETGCNGNFCYSRSVSVDVKNSKWQIIPNRIHNMLTLVSPINENQNIQLNIYNMEGQKVKAANIPNSRIIYENTSNLARGNYILQIITGSGKQTTIRFVKE